METGVNAVASDRVPKRYQVLNKALMSTISEVMCTSEHATPLLGKNIQINNVSTVGVLCMCVGVCLNVYDINFRHLSV